MSTEIDKRKWAWEFLRRNVTYRASYALFDAKLAALHQRFGTPDQWREADLADDPEVWHYEPQRGPTETERAWRIRAICSGLDPAKALLHKGMARIWRLEVMVDPLADYGPRVRFLPQEDPSVWFRLEDVEAPAAVDARVPTAAYVRIDAEKSISRQLRAVRRMLILRQRSFKKEGLKWRTSLYPERWPQYLRILDAFTSGANAKEIAKAEFPHLPDKYPEYAAQVRVRATLDQANALVDGGYRWLLTADD